MISKQGHKGFETLVVLVVKELIKWVVCIAHSSACIVIPHTSIMAAILLAWKLHVPAPGMGNLDIKLLLSDIITLFAGLELELVAEAV